MVERAGETLRREALTAAAALRRDGRNEEARTRWLAARSDLELLAQLTPHWFRHRLATWFVANGDLRAGMEQGGWRDVRSIIAYSHDVTEHRRNIVTAMEAPAAPSDGLAKVLTRGAGRAAKMAS
jgi:integrase